jgi:hypothetical protein
LATATEKGWVHFNGLHPSGTGSETFRIATKRILDLRAKGHFRKFLELFSIEEVLVKPTVIFEGLCRPHLEDGFCYCATPTRRYTSEDGGTAQAYPGLVFAVFVTRDLVVFEFGWERMSGIKLGFPDKYETRFTKQKYPEVVEI